MKDLHDKIDECVKALKVSVWQLQDAVSNLTMEVEAIRSREIASRRARIHAVSKELDNDG